jgi:hypothetical protein
MLLSNATAQAPQKMSYPVIRDVDNALVKNHIVAMKISIESEGSANVPVYVETQTPVTNENGLVSLEMGGGIVFYVDNSRQHGLIIEFDFLWAIWSNVQTQTGTAAQRPWDGFSNSLAICNQPGMTSNAAKTCFYIKLIINLHLCLLLRETRWQIIGSVNNCHNGN